MLNFYFLKKSFINFIKNNLYLDFFLKKILKKFIYNVFIYLGFFFAEKYLIEWNTKYLYIYTIYSFLNFFKKINLTNLNNFIFIFLFNIIVILI